jgi:hypothetical protein
MQGIGKSERKRTLPEANVSAPQPLVNRETVAIEMVQSVEQQQPQSTAESAP